MVLKLPQSSCSPARETPVLRHLGPKRASQLPYQGCSGGLILSLGLHNTPLQFVQEGFNLCLCTASNHTKPCRPCLTERRRKNERCSTFLQCMLPLFSVQGEHLQLKHTGKLDCSTPVFKATAKRAQEAEIRLTCTVYCRTEHGL